MGPAPRVTASPDHVAALQHLQAAHHIGRRVSSAGTRKWCNEPAPTGVKLDWTTWCTPRKEQIVLATIGGEVISAAGGRQPDDTNFDELERPGAGATRAVRSGE